MKPLNEWEIDQDGVYQQRMAEYTKDLDKYEIAKRYVDEFNKEEKKGADENAQRERGQHRRSHQFGWRQPCAESTYDPRRAIGGELG